MLHSPMQFCTLLRLFCCEGSGHQQRLLSLVRRDPDLHSEAISHFVCGDYSLRLPGRMTPFSVHPSTVFVKEFEKIVPKNFSSLPASASRFRVVSASSSRGSIIYGTNPDMSRAIMKIDRNRLILTVFSTLWQE